MKDYNSHIKVSPNNKYIILENVELTNVPDTLEIEGARLVKKAEFHLTLLDTKKIASMLDGADKDKIQDEIIADFKEYNTQNPINDFELLPEFRFAQRGDKKTVVVMVALDTNRKFFEKLRKKYSADIPDQPSHITILSLHPTEGISIVSKNVLNECTKVIDMPELRSIKMVK